MNMKVLYIAHYTERGGWARAAIDQILALDSVGVDVVCRPAMLTKVCNDNIPQRIMELQEKNLDNVTHCIQHVLPHCIVGTQQFEKNVAYFVNEGKNLEINTWHEYLNLCDEVFVANNDMKNNLSKFLDCKISYAPHAFNVEQILSNANDSMESAMISNKFKFYCIQELSDRKNLISTLKAYLSEFSRIDNTVLIVKINKFGMSPEQLLNTFEKNIIPDIVKTLRLGKRETDLPSIIPIVSHLTDEQIISMHSTCDCFVLPSHGEAWCIPAFEAMIFGNTPICSKEGGPKDFIDENNHHTGSLISGTSMIPFSRDSAFPFVHTGNDSWFQPNEIELREKMRFYYNEHGKIDKNNSIQQAKKFDYTTVGTQVKELLQS